MKKKFNIGNSTVGYGAPVFIIAEVSANHNQDYDTAVAMIKEAKRCGADAVKFQAYTPETMTIDCKNECFMVDHPVWGGQSLFELYQKAYTPLDWLPKLKKVADEEGIVFFATAFDFKTADFLDSLDVAVHKVASFEMNDIPLIRHLAQKGKPLMISTGMGSLDEMKLALNTVEEAGLEELLFFKCVSSYPATAQQMNLSTIKRMQNELNCIVGLSDHSEGVLASVASVAMGAVAVEKHFILDKSIKTPDSFFSIDPKELKELVDGIRFVEAAIGSGDFVVGQKEEKSKIFRRSLFAVADIQKGEVFTSENVRSIRPANGLAPVYYDEIIGKIALSDIKFGTPISKEMIALDGGLK